MSMNFDKPITEDQQSFIKELLGDKVAAMDSKTVLFNQRDILQKQMKEIANATKQVVEVALHAEGEIKTLSDGKRYRVTASGWERLDD